MPCDIARAAARTVLVLALLRGQDDLALLTGLDAGGLSR